MAGSILQLYSHVVGSTQQLHDPVAATTLLLQAIIAKPRTTHHKDAKALGDTIHYGTVTHGNSIATTALICYRT